MYDSSRLIKDFLSAHVSLTSEEKKAMRERRDANVKRIEDGLADMEKPKLVDTIDQGGHAMDTMTQPPQGDEDLLYDIDLGVVFDANETKTPLTTRDWVRAAIEKKGKNFKKAPVTKKKCVRVAYAEGYQCDFPVFRRSGEQGKYSFEISIGDAWAASNPRAVNEEFETDVKKKSPEASGYQLRRIVRLGKYLAKVGAFKKRASFPSGLVVTRILVDYYVAKNGRDDESFYETIKSISNGVTKDTKVYANGSEITGAKDKDRLVRLRDFCAEAVEHLKPLVDQESTSDDEQAKKCWKKVFRHDFFDSTEAKAAGANLETKAAAAIAGVAATTAAQPTLAERLALAQTAVQNTAIKTKPWAGDDHALWSTPSCGRKLERH